MDKAVGPSKSNTPAAASSHELKKEEPPKTTLPAPEPERKEQTFMRDWRRPAAIGWALIFVTFVVVGGWTAVAKMDSAIVAPGVVAIQSSRKTVQHLEGGIIKEILVHEGEHVQAGQVLFRLDPTPAESSFEVQRNQLFALIAQEARLLAERDHSAGISWPKALLDNSGKPTVQQAIADQQKQFQDRRASLNGQVKLLQSKIEQLKTEIGGLQVERESTTKQLDFITQELKDMTLLLKDNLVQKSRVFALQREQSRLQGVIGRSTADEAKAQTAIGEATLQIQEVLNKFAEEVASSILEARQKINDAREKVKVAQDIFTRLSITSPVTGTVQDLKVFTLGGVIRPGEALLQVVPDREKLIVQAHVSPQDMDSMWPGMKAEVRFSAFKGEILPIIMGHVESVSRDRLINEETHQPYFLAQVVTDEIPPDVKDHLVAGMPAELIFPTGARTVLNWLVRPLENRLNSAFRQR